MKILLQCGTLNHLVASVVAFCMEDVRAMETGLVREMNVRVDALTVVDSQWYQYNQRIPQFNQRTHLKLQLTHRMNLVSLQVSSTVICQRHMTGKKA